MDAPTVIKFYKAYSGVWSLLNPFIDDEEIFKTTRHGFTNAYLDFGPRLGKASRLAVDQS